MLKIRADAFAWREVDDQVVALHLGSSRYLSFTGSALLLWHPLVEGTTKLGLSDLLVHTYSLDRARADADVNAFLDSLRALDALQEDV